MVLNSEVCSATGCSEVYLFMYRVLALSGYNYKLKLTDQPAKVDRAGNMGRFRLHCTHGWDVSVSYFIISNYKLRHKME